MAFASSQTNSRSQWLRAFGKEWKEWWNSCYLAMQLIPVGTFAWQLKWCAIFIVPMTLLIFLSFLPAGLRTQHLIDIPVLSLKISLAGIIPQLIYWSVAKLLQRLKIDPDEIALYKRVALHLGLTLLTVSILVYGIYWVQAGLIGPEKAGSFKSLMGAGITVLLMWIVMLQVSLEMKRKHKLEAQAQQLRRQTAEAELKTLQAQIEPHFLFNTLANVQSLIDYDAPQAKRMLESFIDYLRATLDSSRRSSATVGDELTLVERYLELMQLRMGGRMHYAIIADAAARSLPLPPLMLQPLVENAIKHGLEPMVGEAGISIKAQREAGQLILTVLDSGVGLDSVNTSPRAGSGTALKNIRERLLALYGPSASLRLEAAAPHGALATISIPLP